MIIRVLGSAAGGGSPQWNCGCDNCVKIRRGSGQLRPRTQESVAVTSDGASWFLLNASPEIRAQIESYEPLHPRALRDSPIQGIVLTNGDLDHCLGLLSLRESHPLHVYTTDRIRSGFTAGNVLYRTLERFPGQLTWHDLDLEGEQPLLERDSPGLVIEARAVPGKVPLHLQDWQSHPADNIGVRIRDTKSGKTLAYLPAVGEASEQVRALTASADVVFFDGTFWSTDELPSLGIGERGAREMAHWPVGGPTGSLSFLTELGASRRILIHLNNTNPLLLDDSPETQSVRQRGVEVAYDGMEIRL